MAICDFFVLRLVWWCLFSEIRRWPYFSWPLVWVQTQYGITGKTVSFVGVARLKGWGTEMVLDQGCWSLGRGWCVWRQPRNASSIVDHTHKVNRQSFLLHSSEDPTIALQKWEDSHGWEVTSLCPVFIPSDINVALAVWRDWCLPHHFWNFNSNTNYYMHQIYHMALDTIFTNDHVSHMLSLDFFSF